MFSHLCACMKVKTSISSKLAVLYSHRIYICCQHKYSTENPITHYDTLELKRNCSPKQIRSAFIRLSKELHPDKNPNNPKLHDKFVQLNEAYSILYNIDARRSYDASLNLRKVVNKVVYKQEENQNYGGDGPKDWKEYYDFEAQVKNNESIYVPQFLKKIATMSQTALVLLLMAVSAGAFVLQIAAIHYSKTFSRETLNNKDIEIAQNLLMSRTEARKHDFQGNLDRLAKRYEESPYGQKLD